MFYTVPIDQIGKLELKKETKYFIKKIITTIYEEQTGIRFKTKKFIEQLERTPELHVRTNVDAEKMPEDP